MRRRCPFRRNEFGGGPEAPTKAHVDAVNRMVVKLRGKLLKMTRDVSGSVKAALEEKSSASLQRVVFLKEHSHRWVQGIEKSGISTSNCSASGRDNMGNGC